MKKQFQSKSVPRGTRTIWRYLGALFILFTFAIGNVWAENASYTFTTSSAFTNDTIKINDYVYLSKRTSHSSPINNGKFDISSTDNYLCANVVSGYKITSIVYTCYTGSSQVSTGKKCHGSASTSYLESSNKATAFTHTHALSFPNTKSVSSGANLLGDVTLDATTVTGNIVSVAVGKKIGSTDTNNTNFRIGAITINYTSTSGGGCTANPAAPTKFDAGSITENGVTFSITDAANAGKYDIYYSTSSTAPEGTTAASATSTAKTKEITGLTASTKYYAWVRSVCDDTHKSAWTALEGGSFTTLSGPRDLYKINMTATSETNMSHGQKVELTSTYGTVTGGYADLYNKHASDDSKLKVNSNGIAFSGGDPCVILYLNEPLHVGDKIEFTSSSSNQIKIGVVDNKDQTLVTTSNKSYTVASEGLAGKQVIYLWRVSSTTYIKTLTISTTAELPTFRTVTFDPNYTSATNITRTVADGAKVVYIPKDPENGTQEFLGWFEGSAASAFDFSTAITADKTLTAHWSAPVIKHTVTYYDGTTKIGEEKVVENASPLSYANYQTKALHSFSSWKNSADVDINPASLVVTKDTALYAQWTKLYAQSVDFTEFLLADERLNKSLAQVFTENSLNYVCGGTFSNSEWGKTNGEDAQYQGYKFKDKNVYVEFRVEANKRVTLLFGSYNAIGTIKVGDAEAVDCSLTDSKYVIDADAEQLIRFTTNKNSGSTVTLKSITIGDIPAKSDDATLKDLKVGGETIDGFSAGKLNYYVQLPYGSTSQPAITGTANDANVTSVVTAQTLASLDDATITVTAEDGVHYKVYTVHFTVAPKLGVKLINVEVPAGTHDDTDATGYFGGTGDTKNEGNSLKIGDNCYAGVVLPTGKTFQAGDVIDIHTSVVSTSGGSVIKIYADKSASTLLYNTETIGGTTAGHNYFVLPEAVNNQSSLYVVRTSDNKWNGSIDYIAVYRLMAPFIESFEIAGIDAMTIDQVNKTITASVANSFDVTALTPTVKFWANGGGSIDKTGAQNFTNPVQYTVSSAYTEDAPVTYTVTINKIVPAETPNITTHPASANYIEGETIAALKVVASVSEGTLSYQWQEKSGQTWGDITNATAYEYTPTVSAIGSYDYRVIVTNTLTGHPAAKDTSAVATIVIAEDPACKAIGYGSTRALATNTEVVIDATTGFKHISSVESCETGKKISGETNLTTVKLGGSSAYYDIYTTEMNIGSIALSLTSSSNGEDKRYKYAVIFCKSAEFDASKILGVVEQVGGAGDDAQVINTPEVPLGTKLVRIMRQYTYKETTYGQGNSSYIYYIRACLVEPAQEVSATVLAQPKDTAYCPTEVVEPLSYELSIEDGASAAYQWYKGTEAIENEEAATYTPSETGVYTCKVTLTKTGRLPKEMTSDEATVTFYIATAITGHVDAVGLVDAEKTISVTAEGTSLTYKWQACDVNGVVTDETVLGTAASLNITIASETKYYLATVTGTCGTETQVVEARMWAHHDPAHVTATTTWDWTNAAWNGVTDNIVFANTSDEELMSNVSADVPCLDGENGFRSDMLYGTGQYVYRPGNKYFQGFKVRFIADVPGIVKVSYCGTGNTKNVVLHINDSTYAEYKGGFKTVEALVPAGEVLIEGVGGTDNATGMTRIQKIEFIADLSGYALADADKTRAVTEGRFGTICMPKGGKVVNGAIFEIAYMDYKDNKPYKIYFDEVVNGLMEPGMPYIFLPNEGAETLGVVSTANKVDDAGHFNGLYGSFTKEPLTPNDGNYILQNNQYYYVNSADVYVGANRAYIKLAEVPSFDPGQPAYGRRRVSMNVNAEQVVTDIDNLNAGEQPVKMMIDGKLYILRGEKMFDATGRLVK